MTTTNEQSAVELDLKKKVEGVDLFSLEKAIKNSTTVF